MNIHKQQGVCDFSNTQDATEIYLDGTYLKNNPSWGIEDSPWKAIQIQKILSKNGIYSKTVCEIGCGAGEILNQLSSKNQNTNFVGFEISPDAFELCKTRISENVKYFNKNLINEDAFFDTLLCIDVFEHVEDYIGFLKAIKKKSAYKVFHIPLDISVLNVLRGVLLIKRKSVGHLHYFTPATAIATLKDCGYEIVDYTGVRLLKKLTPLNA